MTRSRGFRAFLCAVVAGGALASGVPAAVAHHQPPTSWVDLQEVLAGETRTFTISVSHPSGTGNPIDFVRVTPPGGVMPEETQIVATDALGPGGDQWTAELQGGTAVFRAAGPGIAPGQVAAFQVTGTVRRIPADACADWSVETSEDGGATVAASDGALTTCTRVLKVVDLALVAPQGAVDGTVTAGQANVCARLSVLNAASADVVAVPLPEGHKVTPGLTRSAAEVPCTGSELMDGEATIAAGATRTFDVKLTFGDAAETGEAVPTTLYGRVTAPGASGMEAVLPLTIQPRATLQYVTGTLIPRSIRPGTPGAVFRLTAGKGPSGSPAVELDPAGTTFEFAACPARGLMANPAIGEGAVANAVLEFLPCDVGEALDARYDVTVTYRYTDANGFSGSFTLAEVDKVRVDGTAPAVQVAVSGPAPACCVPPEAPAVRNGDRVTLSGSVEDHQPDSGQVEPCWECFVQTEVRQYQDAGCSTAGAPPISVTVSNSGGSLAGQYQGVYEATTRSSRWHLTVRDEAGNLVTQAGPCLAVDNVKPVITKAETQRVGTDQNAIKVTLSECVGGTTNQLDWQVEGNFVTQVESNQCSVAGGVARSTVVLRTVLPFPNDAPTGSLRYESLPVVGGRLHDRADNAMDAHAVPIEDGISAAPGLW